MSSERLFTLSNRWFTTALGLTAGFAAAAALGGLVLLPYAQPNLKFSGIWDAICSAAGVSREAATVAPSAVEAKTSAVVMTSRMLNHPSAASIGHGGTLALQCAICHSGDNVTRSEFPYLAGQYAAVIYKELHDFKAGVRVNAIMGPFAAALTEQDMIDLAAYYSYLPRVPAYHPGPGAGEPAIVLSGAPLRNIPPCASCHGAADNKAGSPRLEGQSPVYLKTQLQAFASAARRNDISEQMRNIARRMTPAEIDQAASFYAERP
ncbi:c-type cytochrome [Beijerinckia sp. L45]|uniref:c-type cytochrome n=1 Tax=Beijerinckia sp. L45 TaxID=1641855 RepID=UPI00131E577D|nr:c-type cytochrome [Beijerinckia sp. L45]